MKFAANRPVYENAAGPKFEVAPWEWSVTSGFGRIPSYRPSGSPTTLGDRGLRKIEWSVELIMAICSRVRVRAADIVRLPPACEADVSALATSVPDVLRDKTVSIPIATAIVSNKYMLEVFFNFLDWGITPVPSCSGKCALLKRHFAITCIKLLETNQDQNQAGPFVER